MNSNDAWTPGPPTPESPGPGRKSEPDKPGAYLNHCKDPDVEVRICSIPLSALMAKTGLDRPILMRAIRQIGIVNRSRIVIDLDSPTANRSLISTLRRLAAPREPQF